jgi:hypothetical protein
MAETLERDARCAVRLGPEISAQSPLARMSPVMRHATESRMAETQGLGARHRAQRHRRRRPTAYLEYTTTCVSGRAEN